MQDKTEEPVEISKTQLKAEADAMQAVGQKLIDLTNDQLIKLALPERLYEAVVEAKRLKSNGAIKRQKQYIGRLMRDVDVAPIEEYLSRIAGKHSEENAKFHAMERWRTRLVEDDQALSEFLDLYPNADRQQLRTLIRNAQSEMKTEKPPKYQRALFKMIRELTEQV